MNQTIAILIAGIFIALAILINGHLDRKVVQDRINLCISAVAGHEEVEPKQGTKRYKEIVAGCTKEMK